MTKKAQIAKAAAKTIPEILINLFMFFRIISPINQWARSDLNRGPSGYEPGALTTELRALIKI